MPCFRPLFAYPGPPGAKDRRFVFSANKSYEGARATQFKCGRCIGCRLDKSRDWMVRIVHESKMHDSSLFMTPTYSKENLPADMSVSMLDHQNFIRRLQTHFEFNVRYFGVGEYGGKLLRPHYHTIGFGIDFPDLKPWKKTGPGLVVYRSEILEGIWGLGHILVGRVTPQSAGYCARYSLKKVYGEQAADAYRRVNPETGETWQVRPEFVVMSKRPGLGDSWFQKFGRDAFPSDFLIVDGRKVAVPVYYKRKLDEMQALRVVARRKEQARGHAADATDWRLVVREQCQELRARQLIRSFSGDDAA